MLSSKGFRRRDGYEDLDNCNQSSVESLTDLACPNVKNQTSGKLLVTLDQKKQQQQHELNHIFSISDTALNIRLPSNSISHTTAPTSCTSLSHQQPSMVRRTTPHNQSTLSLSDGVSLGPIVLLPSHAGAPTFHCSAAQVYDDDANGYGEGPSSLDARSRFNLGHGRYHGAQHHHKSSVVAAEKWNCVRKQNIRLFCFAIFYCVYLAIGGVCFQIFETPVENVARTGVNSVRTNFLQKYPQILEEDLEEFLKAVIMANDRGISPLRNATSEMNWSFGQAFFFSSTVITTIGYGRVTPLSQTGKIFCIIYAAIGIPLTLVLLSAMVERLLVPASWLLGTLNSKLGHLYQPFNIRLLHLSAIAVIVIVMFFAIPTAIFAYIEPTWGVLDAFYYCFISLTTIGLGDYIPGEGVSIDNRSMYKIFISGYLICGLIAMMFLLTIFYDIPQLNLGQLFTESTNGETEKLRLSSNNATCYSGPSGLYMPQRDEDTRRAIVRIRPHGDDSPSPDEAPSSLSSGMRVP